MKQVMLNHHILTTQLPISAIHIRNPTNTDCIYKYDL